jgi:4-amino-4-deoxy-L-arabinose transferase-like glycosyltransferase
VSGGGPDLVAPPSAPALAPGLHGLPRAAFIFAVVLVARLALGFLVFPRSLPENPRDGYVLLAETLVKEGRLAFGPAAPPTVFRPPGYPAALAVAYAAVGDMPAAVLIVNAVAAALACAVTDRVATLVLGRAVSLPWVLLMTLLPSSVYFGASAYSDNLYALTVVGYLLGVLQVLDRGDLRSGLFAGAAFALAALTRPVLLPFPALLLAYAWLRRRTAFRAALVSALVGLALIAPWTLRNHMVSGRLVPVTTGAGFTTLTGFFMPWGSDGRNLVRQAHRAAIREAHGLEGPEAETVLESLHSEVGYWDIRPDADAFYAGVAWRLSLRRPWLVAKKFVLNLLRFIYIASSTAGAVMNLIMNLALLLLALGSLWRARPGRRHCLEGFWLLQGCFVAMYALVLVAAPRYSLPVQMALAPFAAATLADLWRRIRRRQPT